MFGIGQVEVKDMGQTGRFKEIRCREFHGEQDGTGDGDIGRLHNGQNQLSLIAALNLVISESNKNVRGDG